MTKRMTQEEFLSRVEGLFGSRYDFTKSRYTGRKGKVVVTCTQHGDFDISADSLLGGHGCKACGKASSVESRRRSQEDLTGALKGRHPEYLFYFTGKEQGVVDKIRVTCPVHGYFMASPHHMLKGKGCPECGKIKSATSRHYGKQGFVELSEKVHGKQYDYSSSVYLGAQAPVDIVCRRHGKFTQVAQAHYLMGQGCPSCGVEKRATLRRIPFSEFVARATPVHGNAYTYDETGYTGVNREVSILCSKHGEFKQRGADHLDGHGCPKCSTNKNSRPQEEIAAYLQDLGLDVVTNYKYDPDNHKKEIDIYVPEMRFGIEYHGLYYHSSRFRPRTYHFDKMKEAQAQGIRLVQLFSDEWESRPEVVRQFLANALGYGILTAHARQCRLVEVARQEADEFYDLHHIQGRCGHGLNYGLTHKGELVAVMTFSTRASSRSRASAGTQELVRFASSIRVVGGASRLLKKLVAETRARAVVSYSDNRLFTGGLYERLGFVRDGVSSPNYSYVDLAGARRLHKSKFQHKHLPKVLGANYDPSRSERDNCEAAGYYQLFDCGLTRWVLVL